MEKQSINPWKWQDQYGFVQANLISGADRMLLCSGQVSVDADGNPIHKDDMAGQMNQALDNVETILKQAGLEMSDIVRLNIFTTDVDATMEHWNVVTGRLDSAGVRQASTLLGVQRLYHPDILVEMEATAAK